MDWVGNMQSPFLAPEQLCILTRDVQDISIFNIFFGDMCSGKNLKKTGLVSICATVVVWSSIPTHVLPFWTVE